MKRPSLFRVVQIKYRILQCCTDFDQVSRDAKSGLLSTAFAGLSSPIFGMEED